MYWNKEIMKLKTKRTPQDEAKQDHSDMAVPQSIQDCIRSILSPYKVSWDKVQEAILSPVNRNQKSATEEETILSTEELAELLHVSRVTIFRYMKAGKIQSYKLGRRNLFSLNEVIATLKSVEVANV